MEIKGYKAFNKDMTNMYGKKFEVGKTYSVNGKINGIIVKTDKRQQVLLIKKGVQ